MLSLHSSIPSLVLGRFGYVSGLDFLGAWAVGDRAANFEYWPVRAGP